VRSQDGDLHTVVVVDDLTSFLHGHGYLHLKPEVPIRAHQWPDRLVFRSGSCPILALLFIW
jgi:hypothetical protein